MRGLQIIETKEPGFHLAVIFESWKVSIFNSSELWIEENITCLQKHEYSDEAFVLLEGECTLIISEKENLESVYGVKMERGKVYNILKGVWHTHVLEKDTKIIVIENSNTVPENSPKISYPGKLKLTDLEYPYNNWEEK